MVTPVLKSEPGGRSSQMPRRRSARESGENPEQYPLLYVPHKVCLTKVIGAAGSEKARRDRDESEDLPWQTITSALPAGIWARRYIIKYVIHRFLKPPKFHAPSSLHQ